MKTHLDKYNCLSCGCCCLQVGMPPFTSKELSLVPKRIFHVIAFFWRNDSDRPHGSPCYFYNFKTGKCVIYSHRPKVCREYEAGGENCQMVRAHRFVIRCQLQMVLTRMSKEKLKDLWDVRETIERENK